MRHDDERPGPEHGMEHGPFKPDAFASAVGGFVRTLG
jgi:hypothetical protein